MIPPSKYCVNEPPGSGEHLLTADVARLAGVTSAAIRAAATEGRIVPAHVTPGGVRLFHLVDAQRFAAARETVASLKGQIANAWRGEENA